MDKKRETLFSISQSGDERFFVETESQGHSLLDLLKIATDTETPYPYAELMVLGEQIDIGDYAGIQQSDNFAWSVDIDFDTQSIRIYQVDGHVAEEDRQEGNYRIEEFSFDEARNLVELYQEHFLDAENLENPLSVKEIKELSKGISFFENIPTEAEWKLDKSMADLDERPVMKLTGMPISDDMMGILNSLKEGEYVDIERIENTPEIKLAYSHINHAIPTIMLPGREAEQAKNIFEMLKMGSVTIDENGKTSYNGSVERNARLDIVIGLPASGKSSAIVDTISNEFHSRVIDNDEAKKMIPEFNNGWGADVVHKESQIISDKAYLIALQSKDNIVLPKVGSNARDLLRNYIEPAIKKGYTVNVHYVELDREKALGRMLNRFFKEGRFLDPKLIDKYHNDLEGNKIEAAFAELKNSELISGYSKWDNDVAWGEKPFLEEVSNLEGAFISSARRKPEMEQQKSKEDVNYGRNNENREWNRGTADIRDNRGSGEGNRQNGRSDEAGRTEGGSSGRGVAAPGEQILPVNPIAHIEEATEQNANMIDGILNNGFEEHTEQPQKPQFSLNGMKKDLEEKQNREANHPAPQKNNHKNHGIDD